MREIPKPYKTVDDIFNQVMAETTTPQRAVSTDPQNLLTALRKMFDPVFAAFDVLHRRQVLLTAGRVVPSGVRLRDILYTVPDRCCVTISFNSHRSMEIRIATRTGLSDTETVTTAKWRCLVIDNGVELENRLLDNSQLLTEWIFRTVLAETPGAAVSGNTPTAPNLPPPLVSRPVPRVAMEPPPAVHPRIITLDDDP